MAAEEVVGRAVIQLVLDPSGFRRDLAKEGRAQANEIKVATSSDIAKTKAEIEAAAASMHPTVEVQTVIDESGLNDLKSDLGEIPDKVTTEVEVDADDEEIERTSTSTNKLSSALSAVGSLASNVSKGGLSMFNNSIKTIHNLMFAAMIPILMAFVAALSPMIGGLGIVTGMLAGAATGFGLLAAAAWPTINALKEHEQAVDNIESAQNTADNAQRSYTGLNPCPKGRQAASGTAEEDAAKAVQDAQRGVVQAREDGAEARQATAAQQVADAERRWRTPSGRRPRPYKTPRAGVADAIANYETTITDARQREEDATVALRDAERQLADAKIEAAERVEDARESLADAERALTETIQDAREAEAEAVRDLAEARRSLSDTIRDANQAEEDARESLADARRDYSDAVVDAAEREGRQGDPRGRRGGPREYCQG